MKKLVITLLMIAIPAVAADLTVKVKGIEEVEGQLCYAVVNEGSADDFPEIGKFDENAILGCKEITDENIDDMTIEFIDLPELRYAISIFHDKNSNNKLDKNFLGIPKELLGLSVIKKIPWRVPKFDECSFALTEKSIQVIEIKKVP